MVKLPDEAMDFFRRQGSKGGKKARANQTPEQRKKQAKAAITKRWAKRKEK